MGTIDIRGVGVVLRSLAGSIPSPDLSDGALLALAGVCFLLALMLLVYIGIKDLRPSRIKIKLGLFSFEYEDRALPPDAPQGSGDRGG